MSNYNTILQTNNSSLEEIITKLNAMPDAGGGASLETCTLTVESQSPAPQILTFVNENQVLTTVNVLGLGNSVEISIIKNSLICSKNGGTISVGSCGESVNGSSVAFINNSGKITVM